MAGGVPQPRLGYDKELAEMDSETRRSKIDALACSLEAAAALFEVAAKFRSSATSISSKPLSILVATPSVRPLRNKAALSL